MGAMGALTQLLTAAEIKMIQNAFFIFHPLLNSFVTLPRDSSDFSA
jgi:hypothetical protein